MAGPLSGIGGQTQIPQATQTQNTAQNNQGVRQQEEQQSETRSNEIRPQGAPVNETQDTNAGNLNAVQQEALFTASNEDEFDPATPRGSLVDIAV